MSSAVCRRGLSNLTHPNIFLKSRGQAQLPAQGHCPAGRWDTGLSAGNPPEQLLGKEKQP